MVRLWFRRGLLSRVEDLLGRRRGTYPFEELIAGVAQRIRRLGLTDDADSGAALTQLAAQVGKIGIAVTRQKVSALSSKSASKASSARAMSAVFLPAAYWYCRHGVNARRTKASCHLLASVAWLP